MLSLEALANVAQEGTLVRMLTSLEGIRSATERVADAPLVQGLADAGVSLINDPTDPTNAALTQSPVFDFLSQGGVGDFSALQQIAEMMGETPDLLQVGSEDSPGFFNILNLPETQKVEVTNPIEIKNTVKIEGNVNAKQVGTFAVTQAGAFVVQLASGATIPVFVQGGSVQISGGLEQLAVELDEVEVGLNALGALIRP